MSGELEGLGDVVTGGLTAHAVDPDRAAGGTNAPRCLNCGNFLSGPFCAGCGQSAHLHRSIGGFLHDLMHGVLHFEGKLWHTLPLLFTRPGELTRRYIHGERARFFSPLALFLFSVFLTFAVFTVIGTGIGVDQRVLSGTGDGPQPAVQVRTGMQAAIAEAQADLDRARASGQPTEALAAELARRQAAAAAAQRVIDSVAGPRPSGATMSTPNLLTIDSGIPALDQMVAKAAEDPELLLYKLQSNAYKFAWAIIPLSAPIMWLLFPFSRRFSVYDHLIFITYSLSFMLILLVLSRIAVWAGLEADTAILTLLLYPPVHIYWQLRGTYRTSRAGALLRAGLLCVAAVFILTIFMTGLLALGALG